MMKRICILLAAALMMLTATGCAGIGGEVMAAFDSTESEAIVLDAEGIWKQMSKAVDGRAASSFRDSVQMGSSLDLAFFSLDTNVYAQTDVILSDDPYGYYAKTNVRASLFGKEISKTFNVYSVTNDSGLDTYFHLDGEDSWYKNHNSMVPTDLLGQYEITACKGNWVPKNLSLAEEHADLNGTESYVLSSTFAASDVLKSISSPVGEISFENVDISGLELQVTYYVDVQTFLPVQIEIRYQGIGAMLGDLINKYAGKVTGNSIPLDVDVTSYKETLTNISYGDVEMPEVPAEAIQNSKDIKDLDLSAVMDLF